MDHGSSAIIEGALPRLPGGSEERRRAQAAVPGEFPEPQHRLRPLERARRRSRLTLRPGALSGFAVSRAVHWRLGPLHSLYGEPPSVAWRTTPQSIPSHYEARVCFGPGNGGAVPARLLRSFSGLWRVSASSGRRPRSEHRLVPAGQADRMYWFPCRGDRAASSGAARQAALFRIFSSAQPPCSLCRGHMRLGEINGRATRASVLLCRRLVRCQGTTVAAPAAHNGAPCRGDFPAFPRPGPAGASS